MKDILNNNMVLADIKLLSFWTGSIHDIMVIEVGNGLVS